MKKFQTSGWVIRFTESRDARLRVLAWDFITEVFDFTMLKQNPALGPQALAALMRDKELFCVKISTLKFLNKLCDCLIHNCEGTQDIND